jgi:hypothetical protein
MIRRIQGRSIPSATDQVANGSVSPVKPRRGDAEKPLHHRDQIPFGRFERQMKTCLPCPHRQGVLVHVSPKVSRNRGRPCSFPFQLI